MGFYTPAGWELSDAVEAALSAAGVKGADLAKAPCEAASLAGGGFRLRGRGDKVEVFHSLDVQYLRTWPGPDGAAHHRIASVMLSAIADVLIAAGFGFTVRLTEPITAADDTGRYGPVLLVHTARGWEVPVEEAVG
ncbi:hypothetical protein [Actinomadura violacea]|uniref:Uncharacterized protein n=1 Tax=Actinomadura violacea TaxID=2819934 RepID=A0ABS3RN41_9ACTN|nr:hypothetical protein [Actinomadura violacea]MBO2458161.1 hypothetical protein [Actinomadura violacea]